MRVVSATYGSVVGTSATTRVRPLACETNGVDQILESISKIQEDSDPNRYHQIEEFGGENGDESSLRARKVKVTMTPDTVVVDSNPQTDPTIALDTPRNGMMSLSLSTNMET